MEGTKSAEDRKADLRKIDVNDDKKLTKSEISSYGKDVTTKSISDQNSLKAKNEQLSKEADNLANSSNADVKNTYEKKERLISDELSTNEQLLTVNTDDLLTWRKKGIELVNKMFGTSITVKRNPVYSVDYVEKKEGNI